MDDLVQRLLMPRVTCWVHSTGTAPKAGGYAPDPDCVEAANEIERLRADRDCEKRLRKDSDDLATSLREALTELRDRIKGHPAYAELTEEEELETGGDTAELSYLARVADAALGA